MKNFLIAITLIVNSTLFSQIISCQINKTNSALKKGKLNYHAVIQNPDSTSTEITNCESVLDINKQTSTFYMNGNKINTLKFNTIRKNDNEYVITIKDKNVFDGTTLMTKFTVDTSKNLFVVQWYDDYYDLTIVLTFDQKMVISNL